MYATHRRTFGAIFAIVIASYSVPALAIDDSSRAAARTLVNDGADFFKQGRYEEARRKFMDAYEVAKVPTVAVWAAQAYEKLGKLVAASELYESALLQQPNELWVGNAQQQAQDQAQKALKVLKPRIPTLKIILVGATASETEVTVDNVKVPSALVSLARPVDPGSHSVAASKGGRTVTQTVALVEAQQGSVTLNVPQSDAPAAAAVPAAAAPVQPAAGNAPPASGVPAATPSAANPATPEQAPLVPAAVQPINQVVTESKSSGGKLQRTLGWIGVGVGAAGLALGTGSAIYVATKRSQLHRDGCVGNECPNDSFASGVKQYNAGRTLSTVGFVVGGVCTAAGLTLLLTSPKRESVPAMGLVIGPGTIALTGAM
jgi:hypothetical protein